ncbi:MAG: class II glutamine amidotransferase [Myxococcota bacterium]
MPSIFAASFEGRVTPGFDLRCLRPGMEHPDGWGIGFYPTGEPNGCVLKETPSASRIAHQPIQSWGTLESSTFIVHLRRARWGGLNDANTQPFSRTFARRVWLFAHSGSLNERLVLPDDARFEPVGSSDSETLFCALMNRLVASGARTFADVDHVALQQWFKELSAFGDTSCVWSDGSDLVVHRGHGTEALYICSLRPPCDELVLSDEALAVDLTAHGGLMRRAVVFSSTRLAAANSSDLIFQEMVAGQTVIVREGSLLHDLQPGEQVDKSVPRAVSRPARMAPKVLSITHRTHYEYEQPIARSVHRLRLEPIQDRRQRLLDFRLAVNVNAASADYDDVFGNRARHLEVNEPYTTFEVESRALVEVLDSDPLAFSRVHERRVIPLVWMPWQREILQPYLLPEELPETQLFELSDYAMSFVRRNDYDLLDTLLDINQTIFGTYNYVQGTTSLQTTPFEVYTERRGVCQDFANLFICMARLLGVPARYACGYIYVPPANANQIQSLASHAWVQVYVPEVGWVGFDPTNGVLTQTDHIRVAVGRNYNDATPTSGTIYEGGGSETLNVDVQISEVTNGARSLSEL